MAIRIRVNIKKRPGFFFLGGGVGVDAPLYVSVTHLIVYNMFVYASYSAVFVLRPLTELKSSTTVYASLCSV